MATTLIVSFDVGGTLLSTHGGGFSKHVCEVLGCDLEIVRPLLVRHFLTRDIALTDAVESFCAELRSNKASAILAAYSRTSATVYPEVIEVLTALKVRGHRLITISNCSPWEAGGLEELGLGRYFERNFYSFSIGHAKPEKQVFEHVEQEMGADSSAFIHIGDSWNADVLGPRALGWRACALKRSVYRDHQNNPEVPVLTDLVELPSLLDKVIVSKN